ncbi:viral cathepsin [Striga asiatica]|uniref:Viral cathepsin n=1 Tax=Striga asiatica TaxID=4170 RepID=A0A5A7PPN0_STRAF|nr:viral cathepsin [Striga asiatica]
MEIKLRMTVPPPMRNYIGSLCLLHLMSLTHSHQVITKHYPKICLFLLMLLIRVAFQQYYCGVDNVEEHDHDRYTRYRSQNCPFPRTSIIRNSIFEVKREPNFTNELRLYHAAESEIVGINTRLSRYKGKVALHTCVLTGFGVRNGVLFFEILNIWGND